MTDNSPKPKATDNPTWQDTARWLSTCQIALLLIASLWGWFRHISWQLLLLPSSQADWFYILGTLALGIVNSLAANAMLNWFIKRGNSSAIWVREELLRPMFKEMPLAASLWISLLSGICEEFSFRLVLTAETGPIISSILFGILHGGHRHLRWYIVWATAMGAIFCLLVHLSGSLWPAVTMHFASNFTSFILLRRDRQL
ncbi:CPBP family intramembrane metalloprotease [bacterium]|nr:CPBP family intramembrane metalloprotease [bacterium]